MVDMDTVADMDIGADMVMAALAAQLLGQAVDLAADEGVAAVAANPNHSLRAIPRAFIFR
jgi:hypothetical protein